MSTPLSRFAMVVLFTAPLATAAVLAPDSRALAEDVVQQDFLQRDVRVRAAGPLTFSRLRRKHPSRGASGFDFELLSRNGSVCEQYVGLIPNGVEAL